jgi:hypothetical protein
MKLEIAVSAAIRPLALSVVKAGLDEANIDDMCLAGGPELLDHHHGVRRLSAIARSQ